MELIDFDARFNDALNEWMEKNRKKFKRPEDMEDAAPEFYMEWLETPADWLLLEVGLGGRYDATNVIDGPAASIVTPVSIDHAEFLGDTVERIAQEKGGIFKRGAPGVIGFQSDEPLEVGGYYNTRIQIWTKEVIDAVIEIVRKQKMEDGTDKYGATFIGMSDTDAIKIDIYQCSKF